MPSQEIKSSVDRIWSTFWANETTNPLTVVEQIAFLIFMKLLDENQIKQEANARVLGEKLVSPVFKPGKCKFEVEGQLRECDYADLRWQNFRHKDPEEMHRLVRDYVFPFIKTLGDSKNSAFAKYVADAQFEIHRPKVLSVAVAEIESMHLSDKDIMGDVYEELLDRVKSSGENGQFRSPQQEIDLIVELLEPTPQDIIADPAEGTAGFLVSCSRYLKQHYDRELKNRKVHEHYRTTMFSGYDIDKKMLRIGAMNLMLHGIDNPDVRLNNSVEPDAIERGKYTLIATNPPFSGNMTEITVAPDLLAIANTKKTELLFLALFVKMLKIGGRCGSIVPQGVLFGSNKAFVSVRKELIEHQKLIGVISMPSGVFQPYSGVATAILIFTRTDNGGTDQVFFYDMQADGYSLDQKREPVKENDIPDIIAKYREWRERGKVEDFSDRAAKCFVVPKEEIAANGYDLSMNKYKKVEYVKEELPPTEELLGDINALIQDLQKGMKAICA